MRTVIVGTFAIVAVYLVVSNATGAGKLLSAAGNAYSGGVKVLQGRG